MNSVTMRHLAENWSRRLKFCGLAIATFACGLLLISTAKAQDEHKVTWLDSLDSAKQLSQTRRAPVLVIGSAVWCGPCQMFKQELLDEEVQGELERWIPVRIDVDDAPDDAASLAISSIPAIRILTPDGRLVASLDGFQQASEFREWLQQQRELLVESKIERTSSGKLTALQAIRLLKLLNSRETSVRESAISRLAKEPGVSAAAAVATLEGSGLAERLAIVDLLSTWGAPVADLDPWIPTTISSDRVKELTDWVESRQFEQPQDGQLSAAQLIEVERMLDQLPKADPAAAVAFREQLARMGPSVMPLVRARIASTIDSQDRSRLTAARYRIVAAPELVTEWPGGLERLANVDFDDRIQAVAYLASMATRRDEALLLELFSDPAPLVREITLKGLTRVSGVSANSALVKLLDDDDPNVRVAVLNQLAESKAAGIVAPVVEYLKTEDDPDLIVHAIRCLQGQKSVRAVEALLPMLEHSSWRVRAEAGASIASICEDAENVLTKTRKSVSEGFLKLLDDEDDYVVGIALRELSLVSDVKETREKLHQIVLDRPSLGAAAIAAMSMETDRFLEYASSDTPSVRIAAVKRLMTSDIAEHVSAVQAALRDKNYSVREAAAGEIFAHTVEQINDYVAMNSSSNNDTEAYSISDSPRSSGLLGSIFNLFGGSEAPPKIESSATEPMAAEEGTDVAEVDQENDYDRILAEARGSSNLRAWFVKLEDDLKQMAAAESPAERLAAFRILAAFGDEEALQEVMIMAAEPKNLTALKPIPGVLQAAQRQKLFETLRASIVSRDNLVVLAECISEIDDLRQEPQIWGLLEHPLCDAHVTAEFITVMYSHYKYNPWNYGGMRGPSEPKQTKQFQTAVTRYLEQGTLWQKTLALSLLSGLDSKAATAKSVEIASDEAQPEQFRADALQVALICSADDDAKALALKYLDSEVPLFAEVTTPFLAMGKSSIRYLSGAVPVVHSDEEQYGSYSFDEASEPKPIFLTAPEGVTLETVQALQKSEIAKVAVSADYLAILLNPDSPVDRIIQAWQKNMGNAEIRRMTYRAIAVSNKPENVVHLRRMYIDIAEDYSDSISEFYWTIRTMTGPEILAFRKQIRDERGHELRDSSY